MNYKGHYNKLRKSSAPVLYANRVEDYDHINDYVNRLHKQSSAAHMYVVEDDEDVNVEYFEAKALELQKLIYGKFEKDTRGSDENNGDSENNSETCQAADSTKHGQNSIGGWSINVCKLLYVCLTAIIITMLANLYLTFNRLRLQPKQCYPSNLVISGNNYITYRNVCW
ncbi:hypothetical protein GJ496_007618 [Pomphorhynchus laevis]|nr:hypothetical protein GJ496_007618 [Pomphorhynchus laevis]